MKRVTRRQWRQLLTLVMFLIIFGIIIAVFAVGMMNQTGSHELSRTRTKVDRVTHALFQYNVSYGEYPSQREGFQALLMPPDGGKPFLNEKSIPKDYWGNELLYFNPARRGGKPFEVVSKGPDGELGTEDDIRVNSSASDAHSTAPPTSQPVTSEAP